MGLVVGASGEPLMRAVGRGLWALGGARGRGRRREETDTRTSAAWDAPGTTLGRLPTSPALRGLLRRGPGPQAGSRRRGATLSDAAGGGCLDVGRPAPAFPTPTGASGLWGSPARVTLPGRMSKDGLKFMLANCPRRAETPV